MDTIERCMSGDGDDDGYLAAQFADYAEGGNIGDTAKLLDTEANKFSDFFARINIYAYGHTIPGLPTCAEEGNSRDPPSRMLFTCTSPTFGLTNSPGLGRWGDATPRSWPLVTSLAPLTDQGRSPGLKG
jgi:hypothetical protein